MCVFLCVCSSLCVCVSKDLREECVCDAVMYVELEAETVS